MLDTLYPGQYEKRAWSVHNSYSVKPAGEMLREMAERTGAWETEGG